MVKKRAEKRVTRRAYGAALKAAAVQRLLEGEPAQSIVEQLGISSIHLLNRWKQQHLKTAGPVSQALDARVRELEAKLGRVKRERAVLEQALAIFGQEKKSN